MMRSLWISKTGMEAQQTQLDTIAHNLANVGSNGFKRGHAVFEDLIYQNLRQAGANSSEQTQLPTGLQVGLGPGRIAALLDLRQAEEGFARETVSRRVDAPATGDRHQWPGRGAAGQDRLAWCG